MPPVWLIRAAVAGVWLYEGLWCKLLGGDPNQLTVVEAVPKWGPRVGKLFLMTLGVVEVLFGLWALSGRFPFWCALGQTLLLGTLNLNGVIWARQHIHDWRGMLVKNFSFLILAWVAAGLR